MSEKNAAAKGNELDVPMKFGGYSGKDDVTRIGGVIPKEAMTLTQAAHFFCHAQIEVTLVVDPNAGDDVPGQDATLLGDDAIKLTSIATAKQFSCKRTSYGVRFEFQDALLDLRPFSGRTGRLRAIRLGTPTTKKKGDEDGDDDIDPDRNGDSDGGSDNDNE